MVKVYVQAHANADAEGTAIARPGELKYIYENTPVKFAEQI